MTSRLHLVARFLLVQFVSSLAPAWAQYGDYERAPINYSNAEVNDAVAQLIDKMATGEVSLNYEPGHGYLRSVL